MLKSLRNHGQSQQQTRRNGRIAGGAGLVADAEKIISLSWSLNRLQLSLYQQTRGTGRKYNYWRRNGLQNSKSIELSSSDSIQFNIFIVSKIADPRARIIMTKNFIR